MNAAQEAARRLGAPLPWRPARNWRKAAAADLAEVQARARARTLDLCDLEYAVDLYRAALALCARRGWRPLQIQVETHGGAVVNSYGYRAEATRAAVDSGTLVPLSGTVARAADAMLRGIGIWRGDAPSGPHGRSSWTTRISLSWAQGDMPSERPTLHGVKARRDDPYTLRWRYA